MATRTAVPAGTSITTVLSTNRDEIFGMIEKGVPLKNITNRIEELLVEKRGGRDTDVGYVINALRSHENKPTLYYSTIATFFTNIKCSTTEQNKRLWQRKHNA